jgi:hypothetical protein
VPSAIVTVAPTAAVIVAVVVAATVAATVTVAAASIVLRLGADEAPRESERRGHHGDESDATDD